MNSHETQRSLNLLDLKKSKLVTFLSNSLQSVLLNLHENSLSSFL